MPEDGEQNPVPATKRINIVRMQSWYGRPDLCQGQRELSIVLKEPDLSIMKTQ
jgi:hypothetical protein